MTNRLLWEKRLTEARISSVGLSTQSPIREYTLQYKTPSQSYRTTHN